MIIDVDQLPQEGLTIQKDFDFLSTDLVEENTVFLEPTSADVLIKKVGEEISVKGRITARLSFICSRCLAPFEYPVDSTFDLMFLPEEFEDIKEELEETDLNQGYFSSRSLDLAEVILEQLNLTFPLKPLCSKSCEGICAVCGKIRKDGDCGCTFRETDPRLVKIKDFIKS